MNFTTIMGGLELGSIFAILSIGLYIAFRILNLPDLTVDGSFVTGLAISSAFTLNNQPFLGLIFAILGGSLTGIITGLLHTKLNMHAILAGILTMTGLYSINLHIMLDKPSLYLGGYSNIFDILKNKIIINGYDFGPLIELLIINIIIIALMVYFLKTQVGMSLRATGDNEAMVRSSSINTDFMKIMGFALCNGIVALSGCIYAQYTQTATVSVGTGMLVLGLANIIVGETLFKTRGILNHLISIFLGAIIYRLVLTYAFQLGLPTSDIKLFSALIVIVAIMIPTLKPAYIKWRKKNAAN
ncbi:MAG: ABC transporter permease [Erysipelotrichaceae bacterium]|nr:ABC transporter permease [Erysipelotrichaceae bacterium]